MELGAHVWLRSDASQWGWVPAVITKKEEDTLGTVPVINLTLQDDPMFEGNVFNVDSGFTHTPSKPRSSSGSGSGVRQNGMVSSNSVWQGRAPASSIAPIARGTSGYYADQEPFEIIMTVDPEQLKRADHDDIKLRNLPTSYQLSGEDPEAGVLSSPSTRVDDSVVGGVDDLIGLTHLHEPAILHALRLRYDADIIYTATGPILIAVNPFKPMGLYSDTIMEEYRQQGEVGASAPAPKEQSYSPFPRRGKNQQQRQRGQRLPPHAYQTADDAYRAMMRGLENANLMMASQRSTPRGSQVHTVESPANQSILVSGESGAGKTVTTKIVLNYFAMLSKKQAEREANALAPMGKSPTKGPRSPDASSGDDDVSIEQQVLQSNPILESFGNARTTRNDNSSRFGKYIDIRFTRSGKLSGASIETYLLEKVRLIHPAPGERNYHVFYQFLSSATSKERNQFFLGNKSLEDFALLSQTATFDRRDGVSDEANHQEMLDAMITIGFAPETVQSLMRLVVAVLFAGNISFKANQSDESCTLIKDEASKAVASLLDVSYDGLAAALTTRVINAGIEVVNKPLSVEQAAKACEALMKAVYGAAFDYIVEKVNESIHDIDGGHGGDTSPRSTASVASIGVLDIFGFETFETNNFEQICINYTNEALQQQFNKYVFKLEQKEYEREGILWKFISFPDNQDVLDLIDMKHVGILALLDEQCIVPKSTDQKFTRYLYSKCDSHPRFTASSSQRVDYKFSIEHYAGPVEYTTDSWLEKNKDQLPAASADLLSSSSFGLIREIRRFVRTEERNGRGTIATKSVGAQFSAQLKTLRERIDTTVPHYIRCLKPNDDLVPDRFEPKNIVEQLRCGGVLEAVRVSRAGYPTRYPHDVFMARYYILGDRGDQSPISPLHGRIFHPTSKEAELKRLVARIAFDVWDADHHMMNAMKEAEKAKQMHSPRYAMKTSPKSNSSKFLSVVTGPGTLAAESSVMTPREKKREKSRRGFGLTTLKKRQSTGEDIVRPETEDEFLSLDFASRCAVAGLQLGRTKVFLRREAFDRIEAMRAQKFFGAAMKIQSRVRRNICRSRFLELRGAAIAIQSLLRMHISILRTDTVRVNRAATRIQSTWRMFTARIIVWHKYYEMRKAAVVIQRAYRHFWCRVTDMVERQIPAAIMLQSLVRRSLARSTFLHTLYGIIRIQALHRGSMIRRDVLDARDPQERRAYMEAYMPPRPPPTPPTTDITPRTVEVENAPIVAEPGAVAETADLYKYIEDENWAMVESVLDANPELAEQVEPSNGELPLHIIARHSGAWTLLIDMVLVLYPKALIHRDRMGALPIHHAAAHDNLSALEIIYSAYKEGINDIDLKGRLPIHVAAEFDAVDAVKFLLAKAPEGAFTMIHRPQNGSGGGLPLHVACRNYASIGVITALLAENFASAKRTDENGDLPLHLLLRCGEVVDQVVVKTLLTCFSSAVSRTDMHGDLPLSIALKHQCKPAVINTLMMQFPNASGVLNGEGHSPLFLAFQHNADDRTILGLLNHAPELAVAVDKKTGLLPIQVATEHEHSHFIVHNLLKRDMPIDLKEKVRAQLLPHHYSWNHVVSNTDDMYFQVVSKVLQQCTQPQVLALAHVEGPDGKIALASASPVCKHELRVMLRLFNTLEVVNQRPAYTNPVSDTQIFYALRYDPPPQQNGAFTVLHDDKKDRLGDYVEDFDDTSQVSGTSKHSFRSSLSSRSQQSIEERMRYIRKEKGQQVIAKLTSRSDVVERELRVRKEYHLSRHYVPAIISVHHTVQHAAYSEAMAEPGYCITMEGADTTAENLLLDMRKAGKPFPVKALKRIGISLLHMHEHGLVHCDFGTHNIGKFGSRWKLLGVGGSVGIGNPTDPSRGFYHPPESIVVESKRAPLGKKSISASIVSIPSQTSYDIWAYGVVVFEAIAGVPLSPYACRGKRAMSSIEIGKIGRWDDASLKKALKQLPAEDDNGKDLIKRLLHPDAEKRANSMRQILEHPFFNSGKEKSAQVKAEANESMSKVSGPSPRGSKGGVRSTAENSSLSDSFRHASPSRASSREGSESGTPKLTSRSLSDGHDEENVLNGVSRNVPKGSAPVQSSKASDAHSTSTANSSKRGSKMGGIRSTLARARMKAK